MWAVALLKNPKITEKLVREKDWKWFENDAYAEKKTPEGSAVKFCMLGNVHDVITHATFGMTKVRILAFSTDMRRRQ